MRSLERIGEFDRRIRGANKRRKEMTIFENVGSLGRSVGRNEK